MQAAVKTKKPRNQAVSGRFWATRTYRGRIKDDHKIDMAMGTSQMLSCMEERIRELNAEIGVTCFGQEFNPSTFAIAGEPRHQDFPQI